MMKRKLCFVKGFVILMMLCVHVAFLHLYYDVRRLAILFFDVNLLRFRRKFLHFYWVRCLFRVRSQKRKLLHPSLALESSSKFLVLLILFTGLERDILKARDKSKNLVGLQSYIFDIGILDIDLDRFEFGKLEDKDGKILIGGVIPLSD